MFRQLRFYVEAEPGLQYFASDGRSKIKRERERESFEIRYPRWEDLNLEFGVDRIFTKYDCCELIWKFVGLFSGCSRGSHRISMFSLWRRKIYLPFASLAFACRAEVEPRGESILRRDVEKRDVDAPRNRENDSGRENQRERRREPEKDERECATLSHL